MHRSRLSFAVAALAIVGCSQTMYRVREGASRVMNCPEDGVEVREWSAEYLATGCGAVYGCEVFDHGMRLRCDAVGSKIAEQLAVEIGCPADEVSAASDPVLRTDALIVRVEACGAAYVCRLASANSRADCSRIERPEPTAVKP
jgi:hypothetical protein